MRRKTSLNPAFSLSCCLLVSVPEAVETAPTAGGEAKGEEEEEEEVLRGDYNSH